MGRVLRNMTPLAAALALALLLTGVLWNEDAGGARRRERARDRQLSGAHGRERELLAARRRVVDVHRSLDVRARVHLQRWSHRSRRR